MLLALLVASAIASTEIQTPVPAPDKRLFKLNSVTQSVAMGTMGALLIISETAIKPSLSQSPTCVLTPQGYCDPSRLNAWDRSVVGRNSLGWAKMSDGMQIFSLIVPMLGATLESTLGSISAREAVDETLLVYNTGLMATTAQQLLKYTTRRPRPSQYRADPKGGFEQQLGFPSGHVTTVAALVTAYATVFGMHHPKSPWRFLVYAGAGSVTALTAAGRVEGGRHFPTDVIGGAILGAGIGFLVPYLISLWN
jgi:acid phosphatase family membrane protein YuiD